MDSIAKLKNGLFISDLSELNNESWLLFLKDHPNGNIFQSHNLYEVYKKTKDNKPIFLACTNSSGKIIGVLMGILLFSKNPLIKPFSSRCIIWGGPIVEHNNLFAAKALISELNKKVSKKTVYIQFRNIFETTLFDLTFEKLGYSKEDHLDIIIDLKKGEEALWKEIHPSRKKQIRRSIKRGCSVDVIEKLDSHIIEKCYDMLENTYKMVGLPCPSFDFFNQAFKELSSTNHLKAFIAYYGKKIIGFRFVLIFNDLIYDWYAASDRLFSDKYPNDILPWEVLRWGIKNNYATFDFGGAGKPGKKYGVRDYKMKFGGKLVNYGRYQKINKPLIYVLGKLIISIFKKLKGKRT